MVINYNQKLKYSEKKRKNSKKLLTKAKEDGKIIWRVRKWVNYAYLTVRSKHREVIFSIDTLRVK